MLVENQPSQTIRFVVAKSNLATPVAFHNSMANTLYRCRPKHDAHALQCKFRNLCAFADLNYRNL